MNELYPLLVLLVGVVTVIGLIVGFRLHAFLALVVAAIVVSLMAPGDPATKIARVAEGFGATAGSIGIVIALAAIIGKAMMDSGAADRIVRMFVDLLGEKRGGTALLSSGYVLGIPVFFDTVFYLLVPLARSMYRRTGKHYLKYIMAVGAGGAITHTMVPPTPGPLLIAGTLEIDIGVMIMVGIVVGVPTAMVGLLFAGYMDRLMPIPLRLEAGGVPDPDPVAEPILPPLLPSLLPIILPVLLISSNTIVGILARDVTDPDGLWPRVGRLTAIVGNSNLALLLSAGVALWLYQWQRRPTLEQLGAMVEEALMSGGVIILITAAGGAFGAMLKAAEIGPAIESLFSESLGGASASLLFLAFGIAALLKTAQGSSTVAMITASSMLAAMLSGSGTLPFHPVYLGMAIASGSLVLSWMNDSGFWIYTKMGGLTVVEGLKTWTTLLAVLGCTGFLITLTLAFLLPMR